MRIVSLLPSATEIVCLLGLQDQLVGVTHECDYPAGVHDLPKVTKTLIPHDASSREIDGLVRERLSGAKALYSLNMPVLEELKPDLIVTQALCDVCAVADEEVREAACSLPNQPQVVNLEPTCLEEVFQCIDLVAAASGREAEGREAVLGLRARVAEVASRSEQLIERPTVAVLEWIDPPFCSGHWTPEIVRLAGGKEVLGLEGEASRTIDWSHVVAANPDVLLLACCGFDVDRTLEDLPILEAHPEWKSLKAVQQGKVYVVDGSAYFSRPGPRLVDSLEIIAHCLHPQTHPPVSGLPIARPVYADSSTL